MAQTRTRQVIDHTTDRIPIDDQVAEAVGIVAETEFDLQRRLRDGLLTLEQANQRRRRRHGILATLKWLQDHRDTVVAAHKMVKEQAAAEAAKIVETARDWDDDLLTDEE